MARAARVARARMLSNGLFSIRQDITVYLDSEGGWWFFGEVEITSRFWNEGMRGTVTCKGKMAKY